MAVYKRGGVYWYAFERNGKRIQQSSGVGNKREAEAIEAAHKTRIARINAGIEDERPLIKTPLFSTALKAFLKWSETVHASKPETARRYRISAVALLEFFKERKLSDIHSSDVEKFMEWRLRQTVKAPANLLKTNPHARTSKPIQPATVNRELSCLRALYNYQINQGARIANPVSGVKFLAENEDTFYVVSREEEVLYLKACSQPLHDVAVLILETGMRPDEVYAMQCRHLHLDQSYYQNPKGKTKAARRRIELSRRAVEMLTGRLDEVSGVWLFPSTRRKTERVVKLNNAHRGAIQRSKLPRFRIYDLRHTWATRMVEAGVDLLTLASMLGHKRLDMVMKYAHPSDTHKRGAVLKFEAKRAGVAP